MPINPGNHGEVIRDSFRAFLPAPPQSFGSEAIRLQSVHDEGLVRYRLDVSEKPQAILSPRRWDYPVLAIGAAGT